ncbi:MAG: ABC transporter substrate-binding protein [Myxococcales bacterium]|nr:ABC transporter substrate-binding protein [Myxococcales bacterium]
MRSLATIGLSVLLAVTAGCERKRNQTGGGGGSGESGSGGAGGGVPDNRPVMIGHFASMTGSEATFGQSTDRGIRLAIAERNAAIDAGTLKGRKIDLTTEDDAGKPQEAGTAVTKLITRTKVVAILGEVASGLSMAGGQVAQQYGVPMISPSSTNPAVTQIGDMIFRVCFLDEFQGKVVAKFAVEELKAKKVAILFDQGQPYSKGLADFFEKALKAAGGEVATRQAYDTNNPDVGAQLASIKDANPDAVFLPGYYTQAANIARQARKLGITVPFLGGDGWDSAKLEEIGGDAVQGSFFSNHYSPEEETPAVQNFVAKYKAKHGAAPDALAALGYDAANLLFAAIDRSPSLSGKDLAATIAATKGFAGVTGEITINGDRDASKSAVVVKIDHGKRPAVKRYPAE